MPTPKQTNEKLDALITYAVDLFKDGTISTEKKVFSEVLGLIKTLGVDRFGNLKQTKKNIRILNKVRDKIEPVVLSDAYKKKATKFMKTFPDVGKINDEYLTSMISGFKPSAAIQQQIIQYELEVTANSLVGAGIEEQVIDPVKRTIQNAVMNGGGYDNLVEELREQIKGIPGQRLGSLSSYADQIATDSMNQFSRNYVQAISKDLDFKWYYYSGGIKSTSRKYCKQRAGRTFHIEEVEQSSHQKWAGKMKGTNESNILTNCGGYNCGHRYLPRDEDNVSVTVKRRAAKKGYYKPKKEKTELSP